MINETMINDQNILLHLISSDGKIYIHQKPKLSKLPAIYNSIFHKCEINDNIIKFISASIPEISIGSSDKYYIKFYIDGVRGVSSKSYYQYIRNAIAHDIVINNLTEIFYMLGKYFDTTYNLIYSYNDTELIIYNKDPYDIIKF